MPVLTYLPIVCLLFCAIYCLSLYTVTLIPNNHSASTLELEFSEDAKQQCLQNLSNSTLEVFQG